MIPAFNENIENETQLENTRVKLRELESHFAQTFSRPADNEQIREMTLRSLKKRINQFKEEITRYESRAHAASPGK
jgi:hypothetical protein